MFRKEVADGVKKFCKRDENWRQYGVLDWILQRPKVNISKDERKAKRGIMSSGAAGNSGGPEIDIKVRENTDILQTQEPDMKSIRTRRQQLNIQ